MHVTDNRLAMSNPSATNLVSKSALGLIETGVKAVLC